MINPITAKITPQLLKAFMPKGMNITIAEPTALDSWVQFFKNVPQLGIIVLMVIFSGIMANEFSRGTLINMLTKGLPRSIVIFSKFSMAATVWTFSYALCSVVTYLYTEFFWGSNGISNIPLSLFSLWLFGILILAMIMLSGVLFNSSYGGLLFTGGFVVVLMLINIVPGLQKYNPISLASRNMALLTNEIAASDFLLPISISIITAILALGFAIALFNKKQV